MHVIGDPDGVAALKALAGEHRDYLKFLITEAQSSTTHSASFKGPDETRWEVKFHPESGDLEVRRPRDPKPSGPLAPPEPGESP
jgi:hypothetical protein